MRLVVIARCDGIFGGIMRGHHAILSVPCTSMIWSEDRFPPRIKSGASLFGIMPQPGWSIVGRKAAPERIRGVKRFTADDATEEASL